MNHLFRRLAAARQQQKDRADERPPGLFGFRGNAAGVRRTQIDCAAYRRAGLPTARAAWHWRSRRSNPFRVTSGGRSGTRALQGSNIGTGHRARGGFMGSAVATDAGRFGRNLPGSAELLLCLQPVPQVTAIGSSFVFPEFVSTTGNCISGDSGAAGKGGCRDGI